MTRLISQLEGLRSPVTALLHAQRFPIGMTTQRSKDALKRRNGVKVKHMIQSANAETFVADAWPMEDGERVSAIVPGDFVAGDIIPAVLARQGAPASLWITTLSLSQGNIAMLGKVLDACPVRLFISSYFEHTSPELFAGLDVLRKREGFEVCTGRLHTKILLFEYERPVVIEGSANLRSSDCLEQLTLTRDAPLFFFHRDWLTRLWTLAQEGHDIARL